jgi:hypothetical protein
MIKAPNHLYTAKNKLSSLKGGVPDVIRGGGEFQKTLLHFFHGSTF